MEKLLRKPNIWDLHIHTPLGTPTKKNYGGVSSEIFVDELIKIYENASNKIGMISFTDHNKINAEAYKLFVQKSDIAILPGIEVDVYLTENAKDSKHIIFYFEETEIPYIDELKQLVEKFIEDNAKVNFEEFILYLIFNKKKFAVSPHAFKQDKRGIDFDWFDEMTADKGTNQFTGLFFPFWEAGGKSDICKAIEFLEEQYGVGENKHAVIAFSDSADYLKLSNYIENPHQYFLCLNSFKGLLLAGSDINRIVYECETRPEKNPSEKIKSIVLSNNLKALKENNKVEIEFSDRLNVIVGGRGKGKSALLDAIVSRIDDKKIEDRNRMSFVKKFNVEITNFNETKLASDTNILYFSQSYINKLFDGNSQEKLETFFKKQFTENNMVSNSISDIVTIIEKGNNDVSPEDLNVTDDLKNLIHIGSNLQSLKLKKKNDKYISLDIGGQGYEKYIKELLPTEKEIWDKTLVEVYEQFINQLVENICAVNYEKFLNSQFCNLMKKKIELQNRKKSSEDKRKLESKANIEQKLRYLYNKELERIRQINRLYAVDQAKTKLHIQYAEYFGEGENRFYFVSIANKEHPVEYARRMIVESVNKTIIKGFDKSSTSEIFMKYATSNDLISTMKESTNFNELFNKICKLEDLKSEKVQKIIYKSESEYIDLHNTSPGTQTNAVMEFILHSDSTIPLFIDQPEDNIDNEARYSQLTRWIRNQKYNRQIILVTHDANIVINGDAECVIIAEHTADKFCYEYGALEYGDILDKAAIILDGGKTAIHRRIDKYGE